jgi:cytochrome P450
MPSFGMAATTEQTDPADLSFDPLDPRTVRAPWDTYRRLRDESSVHFVPFADLPNHQGVAARTGHDGVHVLSRFADVFAAARDTETFSSSHGLSIDGGDIEALGLVPTIVMMDPPDHTAYRRLVSRGFTPRAVATIEPEVRAFVVERIESMRRRIEADGEADFVTELASPLPSFVVAHYLGVPAEDRPRFDDWSTAIVAANAAGDVLGGAQQAVAELYAYFTDLIERRRAQPGDDMLSQLVEASIGDEPVSVEAVLGYTFVMIAGGNDTVTGLLGGAAELLHAHPDQRQRLVDDPALIPGAVEELLRMTSPVQGLSRFVTRDTSVRGVELAAGSRVHLLYGSANRDEREFGPTAGELDVTRHIDRLMTFSSGPHFCLGAAAARLQGRVALEELLARMPDFVVDPERATYAPGAFVRRFERLPITA